MSNSLSFLLLYLEGINDLLKALNQSQLLLNGVFLLRNLINELLVFFLQPLQFLCQLLIVLLQTIEQSLYLNALIRLRLRLSDLQLRLELFILFFESFHVFLEKINIFSHFDNLPLILVHSLPMLLLVSLNLTEQLIYFISIVRAFIPLSATIGCVTTLRSSTIQTFAQVLLRLRKL